MFASKDLFFTRPSGYQISRSVRTRSSASAYFNRTPAAAGNRQIWTWSGWFKRGILSTQQRLFSCTNASSLQTHLSFTATTDTFTFQFANATVLVTSQVFRDPSAWYHVVMAIDTTQATAANRTKMYINGSQVTAFSTATYMAQNATSDFNNNVLQTIASTSTSEYFDGYLTEINFIDGQALTPSSFGQINANGVWSPIKYTGTYGTNGFYLNFSDNSNNTATTIGKDYSGNGNNWTPNNISVTAGVTYDSMVDVTTPYADGSTGRGNYCVMNPVDQTAQTLTGGNLNTAATATGRVRGTIGVSSGKWYFEHTLTLYSSGGSVGVYNINAVLGTNDIGTGADGWGYQTNTGNKYNNGTSTAYGTSSTTNDIIMCALDLDNSKIWWGKNGTWFASGDPAAGTNAAFTNVTGYTVTPAVGLGPGSNQAWAHNFGQRPFSYTPPTGFSALNTQNLPTPTIVNGANYMAASTYTGTGATQSIVNSGNNAGAVSFQPDFVWVKGRSGATDHALYDSVRGTTKDLASNTTAVETTQSTGLTAFGSTGFTIGALAKMNTNAATYVGWQWQAGQGSTSSNTSGSITSTVSVNATAGFSIVGYTGTGANATVGHGLGVAPKMVIVKNRQTATNWPVYHASVGAGSFIYLNTTAATVADPTCWNSTAPTSTVFSLGSSGQPNNPSNTYVAYCFAEVAGFSKIGSYTGNGSADGPFVYLGFRPRWVMVKRTDSTSDWYIWDTSRDTYNVVANTLLADTSGAETSATSIDDLSNGFKCRSATVVNVSTGTYIYAAFAENPFKYSLAR